MAKQVTYRFKKTIMQSRWLASYFYKQ